MGKDPESRIQLSLALRAAAASHRSGNFVKMMEGYEPFDTSFPTEDGGEDREIHKALAFWDSWIDDAQHDFANFCGIEKQEWPELAEQLADYLDEKAPELNPKILRACGPYSDSSYEPKKVTISGKGFALVLLFFFSIFLLCLIAWAVRTKAWSFAAI